ncbi:MAG TPA: Methionyl-tRNA formyltransferase [Hyphomicrobiaceae bacterium MAG_BT-2024]
MDAIKCPMKSFYYGVKTKARVLRVIFMGTPMFAVPTLARIVDSGYKVSAVYSQPPRRSGRGMEKKKSPVHQYAEKAGLPVFTPTSLRSTEIELQFSDHMADVVVVVAYGLILPRPILKSPLFGCLNLHASKLPRWRGAAPIQRAIIAGDIETALTVMRMDEGLDTGPVCLRESTPIGPNTTAGELHNQLSESGASLMIQALLALQLGSLEFKPQSEENVTYAVKIEKSETRLHFSKSAQEVHNHIRGLSPSPSAWFIAPSTISRDKIKVLRSEIVDGSDAQLAPPGTILDERLTVACTSGAIRFVQLQRSGKKPLSLEEFIRGFIIPQGTRLS